MRSGRLPDRREAVLAHWLVHDRGEGPQNVGGDLLFLLQSQGALGRSREGGRLARGAARQKSDPAQLLGHASVAHQQLRPRLEDHLRLRDHGGVDEEQSVVCVNLEVQGHVLVWRQEQHLPHSLLLDPPAQHLPGREHQLLHVRVPMTSVSAARARQALPALERCGALEEVPPASGQKRPVRPGAQRGPVAELHCADEEV
mmetsp:Transcript_11731/g.37580  ORF Transcript_11731/g.37580 Transcript_11731/m.37580 type:complete len:200 (+) Transcript_11731:388-987(+)